MGTCPPPHVTDMHPPPHVTDMHPPPHVTDMHPPPHKVRTLGKSVKALMRIGISKKCVFPSPSECTEEDLKSQNEALNIFHAIDSMGDRLKKNRQ